MEPEGEPSGWALGKRVWAARGAALDAAAAAAEADAAAAALSPHDALAERKDLLDAVRGEGRFADDRDAAYLHLMSRERRVLATVDRVVDDAARLERPRTFLNLTLHEVAMRSVGTLRALLDDLTAARSLADVQAAFVGGDRKIYVGVLLLVLTLCLAFVEASS